MLFVGCCCCVLCVWCVCVCAVFCCFVGFALFGFYDALDLDSCSTSLGVSLLCAFVCNCMFVCFVGLFVVGLCLFVALCVFVFFVACIVWCVVVRVLKLYDLKMCLCSCV